MKPVLATLAVLLLAPCACKKHEPASPPAAFAEPFDVRPAAAALASRQEPTPTIAEPDPEPTPEEVAAFNAPVPK